MKECSFSISARFVSLAVLAIAILYLGSFLGYGLLPFVSVLFLFALLLLAVFGVRQVLKQRDQWASISIGWLFFIAGFILASIWLEGIWVAPSQDDTINHLGLLRLVLDSHQVLLGRIFHPGAAWFGESFYHFYPLGSHVLTALFIYPFFGQSTDLPQLYRLALIISISLWPAFLWWGSSKRFPEISTSLRIFLVTNALTLPMFPLFALGEGGISRIMGMVIAVPLWFEVITTKKSFKFGFIWGAVFLPVMLMIHPSLLVLFLVPVFFNSIRTVFGMAAGAILGALFFYFLMHSGPQEAIAPALYQSFVQNLPNGLLGWFDRLKGPFHYWFDDSMGFGKFLSPKNFLVYLGIFLSLKGLLPRKLLILFAVPFGIAALALLPFDWAKVAGIPFYHSVKRISEWIPLLAFTIACFSAQYVEARWVQSRATKIWRRIGSISFAVIFMIIFVSKSQTLLNLYHEQFHSPRSVEVSVTSEKLKGIPEMAVILIDQHDFDYLRFTQKQITYTLWTECSEENNASNYCLKRRNFGWDTLNSGTVDQTLPEIWWLPAAVVQTKANEVVKVKNLPTLELGGAARLIKIHEAQ